MPSSGYPALATVGTVAGDAWTQQQVRSRYRLVMMGAAKVGKTSIVKQFLHGQFSSEHRATVEELYRKEYEVGGCSMILDILDTSGTYEFPAMRDLAIATGDAFVLVYSIDKHETFEEVRKLRDMVLDMRKTQVPIVIVGNKCDLEDSRAVKREIAETVAEIDWENGFVESSAKNNLNVIEIFKELLMQANIPYSLSPVLRRRRTSIPGYKVGFGKQKYVIKRNSCNVS